MARALEDFVGTFTIRQGEGSELRDGKILIRKDYLLCIGTGQYGDPVSDGIRVGISIVDPETRQRVLPQEDSPPTFAYLVDGTLNGSSYWLGDKELPALLAYQVSLMMATLPDGGAYRAPTLRITIGDPENVGVWGADDDSGGGG